ncbi:glycosyltransferase family 2 protein [Clostridiaceae bacterium 35-E11]
MSVYITIVIPVYNSANTLDELYKRLTRTLSDLCDDSYEILLIDDASKDQSFLKMEQLHRQDAKVKIIQLAENFGQQNALMCGFHYAQGEYIITLDDDLQHPPEEIKKLLLKLHEGYDVVFGIPFEKKHSFYRNMGTKMISYLFNKICSKPKNIYVSSFRAIKKEVIKEIIKDKTSFVYLAPIIFRITNHAANVFVRHDVRKYGNSNYNLFKLLKLFMKLVINYSCVSKLVNVTSRPQFEIKSMQ